MAYYIIIAFLFIMPQAMAQNLVPNHDFSSHVYCPAGINQSELEIVSEWNQTTRGTPDYYHACSNDVGVPHHVFGSREAAAGKGYIGLVAFSPSRRNYREYLHAELDMPLRKGEWYCVSMKVALADNATYICDGIGAALTPLPFPKSRRMDLIFNAQLENPPGNLLYHHPEWITLSSPLMAAGGEKFITLGNFVPDEQLEVKSRLVEIARGKIVHHAYYLIDDVIVRPVSGPKDCDDTIFQLAQQTEKESTEEINRNYRKIKLQSVLFEFDEDRITSESEATLNEVLLILKRNPYYEIEVIGHADIIGSDNYNLSLSKRRSESVIGYLHHRGIAMKRLRINYLGSAEPVTTNDTEEGRRQNRRVEFMIVEKQYEEFNR